MPFEPTNWNVIVLGAWNPAILTPEWIGKNIFKIASGTPIAVEVPLSTMAPWKVKHEDISVRASSGSLEFICDSTTHATLERARTLACIALEELPKTPVMAAGFNLRFASRELPPELGEIITAGLDKALSDSDYKIQGLSTRRTLKINEGVINCEITISDKDDVLLVINFHRDSTDRGALKRWLEFPTNDVKDHCEKILTSLKGVICEQQT